MSATWLGLLLLAWPASAAERPEGVFATVQQHVADGKLDEAEKAARAAIDAGKEKADGEYALDEIEVLKRCRATLAEDPKNPNVHDARGAAHFKLGWFEQSVGDFDRAIELDPARARGHWRRGISCYYAGQYDEGRKQFEAYQTFDDNDVENAVWRWLCMARQDGVKEAAGEILKIKRDPRVPMMTVWDLYAGEAKPEDVLAAAKEGEPTTSQLNAREFYAHLYLGLYYDAAKQPEKAARHIDLAVERRIPHYMWDVAKVHQRVLRQTAEPRKP